MVPESMLLRKLVLRSSDTATERSRLPHRPHGGELPSPTLDLVTACALKSLMGAAGKDSGHSGQPHSYTLLAQTPLRSLFLGPSLRTFSGSSAKTSSGGVRILDAFLPCDSVLSTFLLLVFSHLPSWLLASQTIPVFLFGGLLSRCGQENIIGGQFLLQFGLLLTLWQ